MAKQKQETVTMHNPPSFVVEYTKKWAKSVKEGKNNGPAECAMVEDILTMVEIGFKNMVPVENPAPAEPAN